MMERKASDNDFELPIKRTDKVKFTQTIEEIIISNAPYPITYDVYSDGGYDFKEFTYTEYIGGTTIRPQSAEITARIMQLASEEHSDNDITDLLKSKINNKYELDSIPNDVTIPDNVVFFVGHNILDMMSKESIERLIFNDMYACVKLHPLTGDDVMEKIASEVGWNRILPGNISGIDVLKRCKTAYVTSATELATYAVLLDKDIKNVSHFYSESSGCYYGINRVLFNAPKEDRKQLLNNMINCKWSGLIFDFMDDKEDRIKAHYEKTLELKKMLRPLAMPFKVKRTLVKKDDKNDICKNSK